jgi:23S rRNA pseudouridine1911/1915/1917 synthase
MTDTADQIFKVLPRQVDKTLAAALREWLPGQSWSQIQQLLKARRVMLSGNLCMDAGRRLRLVDVVKLLAQPMRPPPKEEAVRIRYLDQDLVVVEKPAGVTTTRHAEERDWPARRRQLQPTLDELLPRVIARKEGRRKGLPPSVRAVHRLDRETSGLMVFARTVKAEQMLGEQFRRHTTHRRYLAVALGVVEAQTIESRLIRDRGDNRRGSSKDPDVHVGRRAVTHVRPLERLGDYTLVECALETGRTHQIRIHLSEHGHPLCGEKVYRQPLFGQPLPDHSGAPRVALHAAELGFVHPTSGEAMKFESPLPDDLREFLSRLRRAAK